MDSFLSWHKFQQNNLESRLRTRHHFEKVRPHGIENIAEAFIKRTGNKYKKEKILPHFDRAYYEHIEAESRSDAYM